MIFNAAAYLNLYTVGGSVPHLLYDLFQRRSISAAAKSQIKIYQVNPLSTGLTPGNGGCHGINALRSAQQLPAHRTYSPPFRNINSGKQLKLPQMLGVHEQPLMTQK